MEKQKISFKVGDRVKVVNVQYPDEVVILGEEGIVCRYISDFRVGVEFYKNLKWHTCNGTAKLGHGYYVSEEYLEKLDSVMTVKEWKSKK